MFIVVQFHLLLHLSSVYKNQLNASSGSLNAGSLFAKAAAVRGKCVHMEYHEFGWSSVPLEAGEHPGVE